MDEKEKIMSYIRMKGPSLPVEIAKYIQKDSLLVSAYLSELSGSKRLKLSDLKIGRSRLYYEPGQESKLQGFSDHLSEKDKRAYEYLRKEKVLRDSNLDPLTRLSLSNIKDFAVPLEVNFQNQKEIFWKWYMLTNDEAASIIKESLGLNQAPPEEKIEHVDSPVADDSHDEEYQSEEKTEEPEDVTGGQEDDLSGETSEDTSEDTGGSPLFREEVQDEFARKILNYFNDKGIETLKHEVVRKNSDIDFIIRIPSPLGKLTFYCKARKKKSINDADISQAYVNGQLKKLPVVFITTGKPTKKAENLLAKDLDVMNFVQVD